MKQKNNCIKKKIADKAPLNVLVRHSDGYLYASLEGFEKIVGTKVSYAFRTGWAMARTTKDLFNKLV